MKKKFRISRKINPRNFDEVVAIISNDSGQLYTRAGSVYYFELVGGQEPTYLWSDVREQYNKPHGDENFFSYIYCGDTLVTSQEF